LSPIRLPEPLKETVVFLSNEDKLFGLPLGKLQEEVSKTPQTVKVDVQVSHGQSSSNSSPLSLSKQPAAAIKCSDVPRTLDISRRLLSDLGQVDWFKANPSTGFVPNKVDYVLSQDFLLFKD
jgi:hypothetical protein